MELMLETTILFKYHKYDALLYSYNISNTNRSQVTQTDTHTITHYYTISFTKTGKETSPPLWPDPFLTPLKRTMADLTLLVNPVKTTVNDASWECSVSFSTTGAALRTSVPLLRGCPSQMTIACGGYSSTASRRMQTERWAWSKDQTSDVWEI